MVKLNIKAKGVHCCDSEAYTLPFGNASGVRDASLRATQGASEALPKKWIARNWEELREEFFTASSQTPSQVDSAQSEGKRQEQINAALQELAELQERQQGWKEQGQGTRR